MRYSHYHALDDYGSFGDRNDDDQYLREVFDWLQSDDRVLPMQNPPPPKLWQKALGALGLGPAFLSTMICWALGYEFDGYYFGATAFLAVYILAGLKVWDLGVSSGEQLSPSEEWKKVRCKRKKSLLRRLGDATGLVGAGAQNAWLTAIVLSSKLAKASVAFALLVPYFVNRQSLYRVFGAASEIFKVRKCLQYLSDCLHRPDMFGLKRRNQLHELTRALTLAEKLVEQMDTESLAALVSRVGNTQLLVSDRLRALFNPYNANVDEVTRLVPRPPVYWIEGFGIFGLGVGAYAQIPAFNGSVEAFFAFVDWVRRTILSFPAEWLEGQVFKIAAEAFGVDGYTWNAPLNMLATRKLFKNFCYFVNHIGDYWKLLWEKKDKRTFFSLCLIGVALSASVGITNWISAKRADGNTSLSDQILNFTGGIATFAVFVMASMALIYRWTQGDDPREKMIARITYLREEKLPNLSDRHLEAFHRFFSPVSLLVANGELPPHAAIDLETRGFDLV